MSQHVKATNVHVNRSLLKASAGRLCTMKNLWIPRTPPYRCTGLKGRRGGRRSAGDEWFMGAVQISLLCSGLSMASANTTCWRETDPCVCDGERGFHTPWDESNWCGLMCMVYFLSFITFIWPLTNDFIYLFWHRLCSQLDFMLSEENVSDDYLCWTICAVLLCFKWLSEQLLESF